MNDVERLIDRAATLSTLGVRRLQLLAPSDVAQACHRSKEGLIVAILRSEFADTLREADNVKATWDSL